MTVSAVFLPAATAQFAEAEAVAEVEGACVWHVAADADGEVEAVEVEVEVEVEADAGMEEEGVAKLSLVDGARTADAIRIEIGIVIGLLLALTKTPSFVVVVAKR